MANSWVLFCCLLLVVILSHGAPLSQGRRFKPRRKCAKCIKKAEKRGKVNMEEAEKTTPGPSPSIGHAAKNIDPDSSTVSSINGSLSTEPGPSPSIGHAASNRNANSGATRFINGSLSTTPGPSPSIGHAESTRHADSGMVSFINATLSTTPGHSPGIGHETHN